METGERPAHFIRLETPAAAGGVEDGGKERMERAAELERWGDVKENRTPSSNIVSIVGIAALWLLPQFV